MNAGEERLRTELRAESELISPASLRPLDLHAADDRGSVRRRRPWPRQVWLAPVAAAVSVALIVALAGIIASHAPRAGRDPAGAGRPTAGTLRGVDALSARSVWAVGDLDIRRNPSGKALIVHWNGSKWQPFAAPAVRGSSELDSVAGTSPDDLWAVGTWGNGLVGNRPMILHWNGRKWRTERFPAATKAGRLVSVAVASPTDAWAVGQTGGRKPGPLILHWNGNIWQKADPWSLAPIQNLISVTAATASSAWAVGYSSTGIHLAHWNGSSWKVQAGPRLPSGQGSVLWNVTASSAGSAWAVGLTYQTDTRSKSLILHWTGTAWQLVPAPIRGAHDPVSAVTAISPDNVWAGSGALGGSNAAFLHWNGTSWSRLTGRHSTFPGGILGLSASSAGDVWAVGFRGSRQDSGVPQVYHWNGTAWKRVYGPASTAGLHENSSCGPYSTCAQSPPLKRPAPSGRHSSRAA